MGTAELILLIAELTGTAAFAVSGVLVAAEKRVDIFGALALGTVTAVGGGVVRDLLLGVTPPILFRKPIYAIVAILASLIVFVIEYSMDKRIKQFSTGYMKVMNAFDSIGLAAFVVVGVNAANAAGFGENAFLSITVGMVTGIGGGMLRDILAGQMPVVLYKRVYAVAALLGAAIYYYLEQAGCATAVSMSAGISAVVFLRLLAAHFRWNLPRLPRDTSDKNSKDS